MKYIPRTDLKLTYFDRTNWGKAGLTPTHTDQLILIKEAMNSGGDRVMVPDMAYSVLMQAFKKIDNYKAAGPMEFEVVKLLGHEGYYLRPVGKVGVVGRIQYVDDKVPEEYRGDD